MSAMETDRAATKAPGRLSRALVGLFMKRARVVAIEDLADRFRLITLEGLALRGVSWMPGQKVQVSMGSAFVARTYTPIEWDAVAGRTRILGYAHGDGPGSAWIFALRVGDECDLFGPRNSVDVRHLTGPLVVFGDETSIGLGRALIQHDRGRSTACHFEVGDVAGARQLLSALDIADVAVFARSDRDAHLAEIESRLAVFANAEASIVLTGKAESIRHLRQSMKRQGIPASRLAAKAYWAPGKAGLD